MSDANTPQARLAEIDEQIKRLRQDVAMTSGPAANEHASGELQALHERREQLLREIEDKDGADKR